VNLDKLDYCSSLKNLESVSAKPNYRFVKGNILSADLLSYVLDNMQIDTIMHFAAQTHVDNSFGNPLAFTETNVLGTNCLLAAAAAAGGRIKRFIHVSTDEVYGSVLNGQAHEESVLDPANPYAASKAAAEFMVKAYHKSFKLPTIITRGNNVYGPHQFPEKLIPKFCLLLQQGLPVPLHGDGSHTRNFLYVEDVARAFEVILHNGAVGEIYNIGTDFETSNLNVAKTLIAAHGLSSKEAQLLSFTRDRAINDTRYKMDNTKIQNLGWVPQVSWDDGVQRTVEWYRRNADNWGSIEPYLQAHPSFPESRR